MPSILDRFAARVPTNKELSEMSGEALAAVVVECREIEATTAAEIADTLQWARIVRTAAERALEKRRNEIR